MKAEKSSLNLNYDEDEKDEEKIPSSSNLKVKSAQDFIEKIGEIRELFKKDFYACDIKWSLFVAAALSYRCDSQLRPFPPNYRTHYGNNNFDKLRRAISHTNAFKLITNDIDCGNYENLRYEVIDLIHYVLKESMDCNLRTLTLKEKTDILERYFKKPTDPKPTLIFEVIPSKHSSVQRKFLSYYAEHNSTKFAFHGSKIDSFYSILHNGLLQHLCKEALFGEGIYLSSQISTSLLFSPQGVAWDGSLFGQNISCVALCEYINNPKYCSEFQESNPDSTVPNTYTVVKNNETIRIRYLLVYTNRIDLPVMTTKRNMLINWINDHRYLIALCCYAFFLISFSFSSSTPTNTASFIKELYRRLKYNINSIFNNF